MATLVAGRGASAARGTGLGVALSGNAVSAVIRPAGETRLQPWRYSLTPLNGDGTTWAGLTDALRALARDTGIAAGRLTVALMPPLAEARGLELPAIGEHEMRQLLSRGAPRYFVGARGTQLVGAVRGGARAPDGITIAAAASARLVNAIHQAALDAGWIVDAVIPAEAAWGAAALAWTPRGKGSAQLLVVHADRTDLLRVENARLAGLRRFRAGFADSELIAEAASKGPARLAIAGNPEIRRELTRALGARGITVDAPTSAIAEVADQPDLLAAAFAMPDVSPQFVPDTVRATRLMSARRLTIRLVAAAAVLLIVAGVLELWGVRRELRTIKAQRAALAPQLSATQVGRTSVEIAYRQLAALAAEQRATASWANVLGGISTRLPTDAYLTGFRGRGDSVAVEGLAAHAARVFDAVETDPGLVGVRSTSQVRREITQDGDALERFTIGARIKPPAAPSVRGGGR